MYLFLLCLVPFGRPPLAPHPLDPPPLFSLPVHLEEGVQGGGVRTRLTEGIELRHLVLLHQAGHIRRVVHKNLEVLKLHRL